MKTYFALLGIAAGLSPQGDIPSADPLDPFASTQQERLTVPLPASPAPVARAFTRLPLHFVRNDGQAEAATKFEVRGRGYFLSLEQTEIEMVLADVKESAPVCHSLRMRIVGAQKGAAISGEAELPGKFNYFIGNDPALWRRNVPSFAKVRYHEIYPGIDLVYYGNEGQLEYDFVVKPGANPNQIAMAIEGVDAVEVDSRGDLKLTVAGCELFWRRPFVFQDVDGVRVPVVGEYVLLPGTEVKDSMAIRHVAFQVDTYNRAVALVIDPVLAYSTYLGGWYGDRPHAIAVDAAGCAFVVGGTGSYEAAGTPFPTTPGAFQDSSYGGAAFVTKFSASGDQLIYSTFLCGASTTQSSWATGVAVDELGRAIVTGGTNARDFPRKDPVQSRYGGGDRDAFVTKLSPDGATLEFSSFLGGNQMESGSEGFPNTSVRLDAASNIYVTGTTESANFPTANPLQVTYGGNGDWFLTKLDSSGTNIVYSTFLGGTTREGSPVLAVDPLGHVYVAGLVSKPGVEGYGIRVTKLNISGTSLEYSTSLTNASVGAIDVDHSGALYMAGSCPEYLAGTLPTTSNAFQRNPAGDDALVGKLNTEGTAWEYLTYLGGSASDGANALMVDASGNACVAGGTVSADFPVRDALQQAKGNGSSDYGVTCFVTKINPQGSALVWSTYLGGTSGDEVWSLGESPASLALDSSGGIYVVGVTSSWDFPLMNPFQSEPSTPGHRPFDAFVTKIAEPLPPALQILREGGSVSISWPVSAEDFTLESSVSLGSTANWTTEAFQPSVVGDRNVVTTELGDAPKFFRLRKQ